jgi:hypothetical protein
MSTSVFVNVYRLIPTQDRAGKASNDALEFIKMGVYHAGIEIFGQEYSFGMDPSGSKDPEKDGVFAVRPRSAVGDFKESVKLGETKMDKATFSRVLDSIRPQWRAVSYHILKHNCCYFSLALAKAIDPSFEAAFPHYVYKAAGVGGSVVPDIVAASLMDALQPPGAVPTHLINKIEVQKTIVAPKPGDARQAAAGGGMFSMAKGLADKVKGAVGKDDAKVCLENFPDLKADDIAANFGCHVMHIEREQYADVFVTTKGLCFVGENKLSLRLEWSKIQCLSYAVRKAAKDAPHDYSVSPTRPSNDACLIIFTTDGKVIPLFQFTGFGESISAAMGKITGTTTDERLEKAFDAIDAAWRKK